jgi:hypothetical protein
MSCCEPFDRKPRGLFLVFASLTCFLTLVESNPLSGQQFGFPVQLPTTSIFSVNTTVSVPDGGSISLGGNSGSAWSSTRIGGPFRPFGNRAIGGTQFASNASVHVQIISLAEMEADVLSQLPGDRSLEDYARPAVPELTIRQAINSAASRKMSPNSLPEQTASQAESRPNSSTNAAKPTARQSSDSPVTPASRSRFTTNVVDPNGSKQVQDKADFMSRHIGRKKK